MVVINQDNIQYPVIKWICAYQSSTGYPNRRQLFDAFIQK